MSARGDDAPSLDPVRSAVVEALARRAAAQQGEARQRLMLRIEELLAQGAAAKPPTDRTAAAPGEGETRRAALTRLSELVDRLGRSPTSPVLASSPPGRDAARHDDASRMAPAAHVAAPASRNAVTAFKGTWSRLRADQRLRQAMAQVPAMAGPLNSSHVINRTLQAVRELSPEYLDAFMLHVDTLLWLEQASGGDLTPRAAPSAEGKRGLGGRAVRKA